MEENNITVDKAVKTIKGAVLRAQAQASQSSNAIQLSLYYGIGRYVSINLQQAHWGTKALDTISERLQRELPGLRGFSSGNLKKMRIFYEEWQCLSIGSPLANQYYGNTYQMTYITIKAICLTIFRKRYLTSSNQ